MELSSSSIVPGRRQLATVFDGAELLIKLGRSE